MDFSLLLVMAVAVTGLIWLLDLLWWRPVRRRRLAAAESGAPEGLDTNTREQTLREPWPVDYARSFFPVLLVVLLLRSFLVEPFQIPSGSMRPTLEVGDFILVNKFAYGLRLPVTHTRVVELGEPQRGDVMVFRFPNEPSVNFIKRVGPAGRYGALRGEAALHQRRAGCQAAARGEPGHGTRRVADGGAAGRGAIPNLQ